MPRGRLRQTPRDAWRDSENRILRCLPNMGGKGFNELMDETGVSPTTLSSHLKRLQNEEKVVRDLRTKRYIRTENGNRWLEVSAILQRAVKLAGLAGSVGPASGGGLLGRATSVCAMPSPGPSSLAGIADELPHLLAERFAELLLSDSIKPPLGRRPRVSRLPSTRRTAKLLQ